MSSTEEAQIISELHVTALRR